MNTLKPSPFSQQQTVAAFLIWVVSVAFLTGLGIFWLHTTGTDPTKDFSPAIILISYSPALAVFITSLLKGRAVFSWLLGQMVWRVGVKWYALALLGPFALIVLANILSMALGGESPRTWGEISLASIAIGPLIAGALGEELGWRGFAQPLLQRRYSILWASVIVGVTWATWHLYPVVSPGGAEHLTWLNVSETYVRLIATAILYGWLYTITGSLLLVMLAHIGHNIAIDVLGVGSDSAIIVVALYVVAAIVVVLLDKRIKRKF